MASIKKRSKTWYAVWYQDGKTLCKTTGIRVKDTTSRKLAQCTADAMEAAAKGGAALSRALDSVRSAAAISGMVKLMPSIREYLLGYKPSGGCSHISNVKRAIRTFLDFLGAASARRLDTLTSTQCRDFLNAQMKRISYGTVKNYKGYITCVLNRALEDDLIPRNPMGTIRLSAQDSKLHSVKRMPFTRDELKIIFTEFPSPWRELALTSFLTGGQRLGDVALLKWEQIDLEKNLIHFRTMKTGKEITHPIIPELRAIFDSCRAENPSADYVFPLAAKRYIRSQGGCSTLFTTMLKVHGIIDSAPPPTQGKSHHISPKSFHSLRHSAVSILRTNSAFTADLVRDVVGHDSEAIERGYYTADAESKHRAMSYLASQIL